MTVFPAVILDKKIPQGLIEPKPGGLYISALLLRICDTIRICHLQLALPEDSGRTVAAWGEDCAVLDLNESQYLLFAADGIMKKLMDADPFWAGYCSVLVNIHDIASMGGLPVAMVNILSISNPQLADQVLKGIESAVRKFQVPVVGGHTHPDAETDSIAVAIIGTVERDCVIFSHTATAGDDNPTRLPISL